MTTMEMTGLAAPSSKPEQYKRCRDCGRALEVRYFSTAETDDGRRPECTTCERCERCGGRMSETMETDGFDRHPRLHCGLCGHDNAPPFRFSAKAPAPKVVIGPELQPRHGQRPLNRSREDIDHDYHRMLRVVAAWPGTFTVRDVGAKMDIHPRYITPWMRRAANEDYVRGAGRKITDSGTKLQVWEAIKDGRLAALLEAAS